MNGVCKRNVLTIAVGKSYYLQLAKNLLMSFSLTNRSPDIQFTVLTDNVEFFSTLKNTPGVAVINIDLTDDDKSFTSKFTLSDYVFSEQNLFIDCDCLVYKDLSFVFDLFKGKSFSVIGTLANSGSFFCDIASIIKKFEIDALPKFVGSIYYFKNDSIARNVFSIAKNLKSRYDELGFIRLRNKENEEPMFAVAMALNGQTPIADDGCVKADRMFYEKLKGDFLHRNIRLYNSGQPPVPDYSSLKTALPAVVHFNAAYSETAEYKAEALRIRLSFFKINKWLAHIYVSLLISSPANVATFLKTALRPVYRLFFGFRKIKNSKRI